MKITGERAARSRSSCSAAAAWWCCTTASSAATSMNGPRRSSAAPGAGRPPPSPRRKPPNGWKAMSACSGSTTPPHQPRPLELRLEGRDLLRHGPRAGHRRARHQLPQRPHHRAADLDLRKDLGRRHNAVPRLCQPAGPRVRRLQHAPVPHRPPARHRLGRQARERRRVVQARGTRLAALPPGGPLPTKQ
jgi:hypothetical protein